MEFVVKLIEIIAMLLLLGVIAFTAAYSLRHRNRITRWLEHFDSNDNLLEKDKIALKLRRRIEDAEAEIKDLESAGDHNRGLD